ncbi:mucin-2-like isoform X2 [Corticium candelabrum]|uniref:mucin-2-like isoform X2 n=1 Tax=Corticium candelabrum TaxID=121492 RepID=UPI002E2667FE|nr:mucin-2-like isoform X2 [Corticium candelabrum]
MESVLTAGSSRSWAIFALVLVTALNLVGSYRLEKDEDRIEFDDTLDRIRRQDTNVPMPTGTGPFRDHKKPSSPSSSSPSMQSPTTSEHQTAPLTKITSQQPTSNTLKPTTNLMSQEPKSTLNSVTYPTSRPGKSPSPKATTSAPSHTSTESTTILNSVTSLTSRPGKSPSSKATTFAPASSHTSTESTTISTSISTRDTSAVSFSTTSMPDEHGATTPEDMDVTDDMDDTDQEQSGSDKVSTDGITKAFSTVHYVSSTVSIDDVDASPVGTGTSTLPTEASTGKSDEAGLPTYVIVVVVVLVIVVLAALVIFAYCLARRGKYYYAPLT